MDGADGNRVGLSTLPDDVQRRVVGWLGVADLAAAAAACRSLRRACLASLRTVWVTRQFHGQVVLFRHGPRCCPWWEPPPPVAKDHRGCGGRLARETEHLIPLEALRSLLTFLSRAEVREAHLSDMIGSTGDDMDDDREVATFSSVVMSPGNEYAPRPPPTGGTPPRSWLSVATLIAGNSELRRLSVRGLLTRADAEIVADTCGALRDLEVWGAVAPDALAGFRLPAVPALATLFVRATGGDASGLPAALAGRSLAALALPRAAPAAVEAALAATAALPQRLFIPSDRVDPSLAVDGAAVVCHPAAATVELLSLCPSDTGAFLTAANNALWRLQDLSLHVVTGLSGVDGWPAGLRLQRLRLLYVHWSQTGAVEELMGAAVASASLQQSLTYLLVDAERFTNLDTARALGRLRNLRRLVLGLIFLECGVDAHDKIRARQRYETTVRAALPPNTVLETSKFDILRGGACRE